MDFTQSAAPAAKQDPRALRPIAHLWQTRGGYIIEIATGAWPHGFTVLEKRTFAKKAEAKAFAHQCGARPWNY